MGTNGKSGRFFVRPLPFPRGIAMNKYYLYWGIAALLLLEAAILYFKKRYKSSNRYYATAYQKRLLLTKHEWKNYMSIRDALEAQGLYVCPKVRLLDLVEPKRGAGEYYQSLLNKVQSKHVDFTVCDERLNVLLILELDDSSHDATDRKKRDAFVDAVLEGAGYQILHSRDFQADLPEIQAVIRKVRR